MLNVFKFATLGALGALTMSMTAVPTDAEARGFRKLGAAVAVGRAVNRANRANARENDEITEATPIADDATPVEAPLPKLEPIVAAAAVAPISGPPVCIAGCYDKLGQPIRR